MYQKVDTNLNFVDREKKVEEFWKENHIFEKSTMRSQNRQKTEPPRKHAGMIRSGFAVFII